MTGLRWCIWETLTKKGDAKENLPYTMVCGASQDSPCHDGQCRVLASSCLTCLDRVDRGEGRGTGRGRRAVPCSFQSLRGANAGHLGPGFGWTLKGLGAKRSHCRPQPTGWCLSAAGRAQVATNRWGGDGISPNRFDSVSRCCE